MTRPALLAKMIEVIRTEPGITITELAKTMKRSERTIYRWLGELSVELHTPTRYHDGGYYLLECSGPRTVDLTPEELLALRVGLKAAPLGTSSPLAGYARSAWLKIREAAELGVVAQARDMAGSHTVDITNPKPETQPEIVDAIENSVMLHRRLRVLYRSQKSGMTKEYIIDPYAVAFRRHSWYVLAFSQEHEKVIQMKLARFQDVNETGACFEPPVDFSVDDYFRLSWEAWAGGEPTIVRVHFSAKVAPMITESKRHPTQVIFPQPDGSVIFQAKVSGIEEIAIWIMGYGRDAEVLLPESLRDFVIDHMLGALEVYGLATPFDTSLRSYSGLAERSRTTELS